MKQKTKFKQTEIGKIPEDWEFEELEKHAKVIMGQSPEGKYYNSKREGALFLQGTRTFGSLSPTYDTWTTKITKIARKNSVLLSVRAPVGEVNIADKEICIGRGLMSIDGENNQFIFYLFKAFKNYVINKETGTVYGSVTRSDISKLNLPFPPLHEQRSIAKILSDLDAKIELNNKMNKTLEAIGQALFKRWFIDGRKKEWEKGKLGELGKIQPGFAFKSSDFVSDGYKLIKIRNIQNPVVDIIKVEDFLSEEIFKRIDKKFYLESGDILIAMTGAKLGKVGVIPKTSDKMLLNQRVGKVVSENPFLFYFYLTSPEIQGYLKGIASASSAQGNISNSDIERIEIIIPEKEIINKFTSSTKKIFELWISNLQQNQKLSQIRDSLLPKLMSGEIRTI